MNLLGQDSVLQSEVTFSTSFPVHGVPPYFGTGLEHDLFLLLDFTPPPQVTLHTDQLLHSPKDDHPPSTLMNIIMI